MSAIYNEIEPYPCPWLRNLITAGHIADGQVDERSIRELTAADVRDAAQFHAFAGIGVWSYALRLAGWSDSTPVWTGSCPCQPFSTAGKRRGTEDDRHLWPVWRDLIAECRPPVIFGEQVASPDGRLWFAAVRSDLEALGYEVGAADLCAAGVGAPHVRQRIFFGARAVGDTNDTGQDSLEGMGHGTDSESSRGADGLGNAASKRLQGGGLQLRERRQEQPLPASPWDGADYIPCTDGKARPVEPGTFPLAPRTSNHVGRLCAYGNAIVPQVAARFVRAFMEAA